MIRTLKTAFFGSREALRAHHRALESRPSISSGLASLGYNNGNGADDSERPIFLLSAGWRSGSTMLQRLIMSDSSVMMWGEPYDECGIIQSLANTIVPFRPGWPPDEYFFDGSKPQELSREWIANLFPSLSELRFAHRGFFDNLFAKPAKAVGAARWGIKEVRLDIEHVRYLRWIYPNSQIIFLYRNPLDAFESYCRYGKNWYDTFPHKPVFTATAFGNHWRTLVEGFLEYSSVIGAHLVRYEDLIGTENDRALKAIEEYLSIRMDKNLLKVKVGSAEAISAESQTNMLEKYLLKRATHPIAKQLGYH